MEIAKYWTQEELMAVHIFRLYMRIPGRIIKLAVSFRAAEDTVQVNKRNGISLVRVTNPIALTLILSL